MKERNSAKDFSDLVKAFLHENTVPWDKIGSVFTVGAPAMIGRGSGFVDLMG